MKNMFRRFALSAGVITLSVGSMSAANAAALHYRNAFFTTSSYGPGTARFRAALDQTSGLAWVQPGIAGSYNYSEIDSLCGGSRGACTGTLSGLTWANTSQLDTFWSDIGIPLTVFDSYTGIAGVNLLGNFIKRFGPTHSTTVFGITTDTLGGITNSGLTFGLPNTAYMSHTFAGIFSAEQALTFGTGNGYAEFPSTGGWFFFNPSNNNPSTHSVPEPGSLALLGIGTLGLAFAVRRRRQV